MSVQTRRPPSRALVEASLSKGSGLAALSVLYDNRNRFCQFTTAQIADQTQYRTATIGNVLSQAQRLGLVDTDMTTSAPRRRYWRLTVTGCEFVRERRHP